MRNIIKSTTFVFGFFIALALNAEHLLTIGRWAELAGSGTSGISADPAESPTLSLNSAGNPFVAWSEFTGGNFEIYLKHWNGSAWVDLGGSASGGGISGNAGGSQNPTLAIDSAGNPVVAWMDGGGANFNIYVKRWDGSAWVELGESATSGGISSTAGFSGGTSIALDGTGNPIVAWYHRFPPGDYEIYLKRWDGSAWVELGGSATAGGISSTPGFSATPSLAVDAAGNPVIAWLENFNGRDKIYLKRWNGSAWVELGGSASLGGISEGQRPSLALDGAGNPVVAWSEEYLGAFEIYLKRWDGSVWVELGGSDTAGGISSTPDYSYNPQIALDPSGSPVVSWTESLGNNILEIYLKRWNGAAWVELGGSATAGGISANGRNAQPSSLAVDSVGTPAVAWFDNTGIRSLIYFRRFSTATLVSISVSPSSAILVSGQTRSFVATATYSDNSSELLTSAQVTWSSSDNAVATIDANGLLTAQSVGTAQITASSGGISGSATLTVPTPQQQIQLIANDILLLVDSGTLNSGNGLALSTKLSNAVTQLNSGGSTTSARNILNAFINQVEVLIASGRLTSTEGQSLIDAANAVIAQLGS